jgi:hypothetical protein
MLTKFYTHWNTIRFAASAFVLAALILAFASSYAYVFDVEFNSPEVEQLDRDYRDQDNREAADRCERGEGSERDHDRAQDYYNDHGA